MVNGQSIQVSGSTIIDLQSGLISLLPIYFEAPAATSGTVVVTLSNPLAGSLLQIVTFNQSGGPVTLQLKSQDSLGTNIPVIMSNLGQTVFFNKGQTVDISPGGVYSVIGGLVIPDNMLFLALR